MSTNGVSNRSARARQSSRRNRGELVSSMITVAPRATAADVLSRATSWVRIHSETGTPAPLCRPRSALMLSSDTTLAPRRSARPPARVLFPENDRPQSRMIPAGDAVFWSLMWIRIRVVSSQGQPDFGRSGLVNGCHRPQRRDGHAAGVLKVDLSGFCPTGDRTQDACHDFILAPRTSSSGVNHKRSAVARA